MPNFLSGSGFGYIEPEDPTDPNRLQPDADMMYVGRNPELRSMMKRPRDPRAAAFMAEQDEKRAMAEAKSLLTPATQLENPNADRIDGTFSQLEQGEIFKQARGSRRPMLKGRNETTGESFAMPASQRISSPKAREFLAAYQRDKAKMAEFDDRARANDARADEIGLNEIRQSAGATDRAYALSRDVQDRADKRERETYEYEQRRKKDALELEGAQLGNKLKTAQVTREIEDTQNPGQRESRELLKTLVASNDPRVRELGFGGLSDDPRLAGTAAGKVLGRVGARSFEARTAPLRPLIEEYKKHTGGGYGAYYSDQDAARTSKLRTQILQRAALEGLSDDEIAQIESELSASPQGNGFLGTVGKLAQLDF